MDPRPPTPAPNRPAAREPAAAAPTPLEVVGDGPKADFTSLHPADTPAVGDEADPYHRDSLLAQRAFDEATKAADEGREEEAVRRYLTASKLAERAHEWYLAARAFRRVGDFLISPKPRCDLERAVRMYRRAADAYERSGLIEEARELTYHQLRVITARGREMHLSFWRQVELWVYWAVAGYGLRPLRVVGLAAVLIVAFGVLYWVVDGVERVGTREPVGLWESVYFSGITFSTVGYGDYLPAPHMRALALVEGVVGVMTMGFFVAVLANRLRR